VTGTAQNFPKIWYFFLLDYANFLLKIHILMKINNHDHERWSVPFQIFLHVDIHLSAMRCKTLKGIISQKGTTIFDVKYLYQG